MLLGSIRSISWNSLYRDEEENQTSNNTKLGVPDDIPLLGFLAAWSDAQNKQPDNWRYASSLSIPPLAFPGFLPPPAQVANPPSVPSTSLAWWPKTPRLAAPFLGQQNKQRKNCNVHRPSAPSCPHTFPTTSLRYMCVVWLREIGEHRREPANALLSAAAGQPWPPGPILSHRTSTLQYILLSFIGEQQIEPVNALLWAPSSQRCPSKLLRCPSIDSPSQARCTPYYPQRLDHACAQTWFVLFYPWVVDSFTWPYALHSMYCSP